MPGGGYLRGSQCSARMGTLYANERGEGSQWFANDHRQAGSALRIGFGYSLIGNEKKYKADARQSGVSCRSVWRRRHLPKKEEANGNQTKTSGKKSSQPLGATGNDGDIS